MSRPPRDEESVCDEDLSWTAPDTGDAIDVERRKLI
jgi:hypothetical protein